MQLGLKPGSGFWHPPGQRETTVRSPFHMPFILMNKDLNLPSGVLHPSPCSAWWPSDELSLASHCLTYTTWGAQNGHSTPGFSPSWSWAEVDREFLWPEPPHVSSPTLCCKIISSFSLQCFGCSEELAIAEIMTTAPEEDRNGQEDAHRPVLLWG